MDEKEYEDNEQLKKSDELNALIPSKAKKSENDDLINILNRLANDLEKNNKDNFNDDFIDKSNSDKEVNIEVKKDINICLLNCMLLLIFPLFPIFYIIGILMVINISDILFTLFLTSIKCKLGPYCNLDDFKKQSNFYDYFLTETLKEPIDFKIIMFWSFIGDQYLDKWGFKLSCIYIMLANIFIISLVYFFDFQKFDNETYKYSYLRISSLFFLWLASWVALGSGTMISQKILPKYYSIFKDNCCCIKKENKENENGNEENVEMNELSEPLSLNKTLENDNKEKHTLIEKIKQVNSRIDLLNKEKIDKIKEIYITEMNTIWEKKYLKKESYNSFWFVSVTTMFGFLGKYFISIYISDFKKKNDEKYIQPKNETEENSNINQTIIMHFLLNETIDNRTIITNQYNFNQKLFLILYSIYILFTLLSIFFYWIFEVSILIKKKDDEEKNKKEKCTWECECKFINCLCYCERIPLKNGKPKVGCCKLCIETFNNYCELLCCNNILLNCGNKKNEKHCCIHNENDYIKDYQCFCYCYQQKRFCNWFDKFIINDTQKEIIPCMFLYLIAKLITIKNDNEFENMIENNLNFGEKIDYLIVMIITFILIIFLINKIKETKEDESFKINAQLNCFFYLFQNSEILIEILFILFFDSYISFYYTIKGILKKYEDEKEKETIFYFSIILNKLFIFSLNFYCIDIYNKNKGNEILLSQSTLISLYLFIIDTIIYQIKKLIKNENNLLIIQLAFSFVFTVGFSLIMIINVILASLKSCCFCVEGNFYCIFCCCNNKANCCECCYSESCDNHCSHCKICYSKCCIDYC